MSWERASSSWDSRPDAESELLVFGYSAKLFKDDVQAQIIEDGNHLIPWMGHQDNLIDRSVNQKNTTQSKSFVSCLPTINCANENRVEGDSFS